MTDYIRQLVTMGGIFYAETNKVSLNQLKLTNANVKMFLEAVSKGFNISELIFDKYSISENNFDMLIDIIINRSSIHCLEIANLDVRNPVGL
jgi:hypothetical protein